MKIIFMGTPAFALPALKSLLESQHEVVAIFSQAPKPRDRGMVDKPSPVHMLANEYNIPVYTPKTLRNDESVNLVASIEADIIVVVAYGFIIPESILKLKKYCCLNIHPSALPRWRGAAPLQRTIIAGDRSTDICIMQMDAGMDTGDVILRKTIELGSKITLLELHDKCADIGAELLMETLENIASLPRIKQQEEGLLYANKLTKAEGEISWNDSAFSIDCKIRGMNPWPGVYFKYDNMNVKILEAEYSNKDSLRPPGTVLGSDLSIACGKGVLSIKKLQRPGKNPVMGKEFVKANDIKIGDLL